MSRQGVQYINNDEPSFIKQFKARVGHKDGPDVNSKREIPNFDEDSDEDPVPEKDDEKPVVVVLKKGDLSEEQAQEEKTKIDEGPARLDEKIKFKKPVKRSKEPIEDSTDSGDAAQTKKRYKMKKKEEENKKKTSSLLSFDEEEEEED